MIVKKIALPLLMFFLFSLPAGAQLALEPHSENGVTFVSGGIGEEGLQAIHEIERDYNLRLLFAVQRSGNYLSDVNVKLLDQSGKTLVDTMSQGPYFLAKLSPGKYQIIAESGGKPIIKSVVIAPGRAVSQALYWPAAQ